MTVKDKLIKEALFLPVPEKTELINHLIESLDEPEPRVDALWKELSENRIDAYEPGKISSVTIKESFFKIQKVKASGHLETHSSTRRVK
ncbi:MAG: addiction module protein [Flavobacteriaceae bacterium]|nr:addiction module protein [Flavobacteriaceae bacterium]